MIFDFIQLSVGVYSLYYFSNLLIDNASLLASRYNVSKAFIGLTLVAFGTSLPEFIVSMVAVYNGELDIVIGNVIGSNIANIGLVIGISGLLYKLLWDFQKMKINVIFLCISTILFSLMLYSNIYNIYTVESVFGVLLVLLFIIYMYLLFSLNKRDIQISILKLDDTGTSSIIIFVFLASVGLSFGSQLLIDGAIGIAGLFNISSFVIGATIIALGTSLPELATSLNAARKNEFELLLGNIFGSNIINIVFVFGVSLLVNDNIMVNDNSEDNALGLLPLQLFDLKIFLLMTFGFVMILVNNKIHRLHSVILLSLYAYYIYGILKIL